MASQRIEDAIAKLCSTPKGKAAWEKELKDMAREWRTLFINKKISAQLYRKFLITHDNS